MNRKRQGTRPVGLLVLALALLLGLSIQISQPAQGATNVFINELHYDNAGADTDEAVEIAGPAGTNLAGWSVALYNGSATQLNVYDTIDLSGVIPDQQNGCGALSFARAGIQNGSPDGLALLDIGGNVVQFLSYEGSFTAGSGPAAGMTSVDIGVAEGSATPVGNSLQLSGSGAMYEDFTWSAEAANTFGAPNNGQAFTSCAVVSSTDPTGAGMASPATVTSGDTVLLTVNVTPGTGPDSTGLTVTGDLTAIGGAAAQAFFDDATNGDETAGDNIFSYATTVSGAGTISLPITVADAEGRSSATSISLDVIQALTIMQIQGSERYSPFDGQVVETSGVVTLFTANGANFWLQDPNGDGDPATSDGIFVAGGGFPNTGPRPEVGDSIRIIALVEEQQFGNALPLTRLRNVDTIEVLSSGNRLPAPVPLVDLPDFSIPEGEAFWEPLEGMRVSVQNAPVIAATSGFGEFGMLAKDDAKPGSGFFADTQQILVQSLGDEQVDFNPERIMVDDSSLNGAIMVQPGDRVRSLVGVVDYTFSMYKLQPEPGGYDIQTHNLPNLPASTRSGGFGNATITTFNVENLFDDFADPNDGKDDEGSTLSSEELETKLTKLALAIQVELQLPAILVVQEVENTEILQELGNRVNAASGTSYVATSFETSDVRGIEVGFLWDSSRVTLLDAFQMSGPEVEAWFGPNSPSPGREPLVGLFDINGNQVTIIGNHFKSKGGDDPLYGVNWPPVRITEVQRKGQAGVVRSFVNGILDTDPDALVLVAGDLNDFQFSEPGEGADNPVAILEGGPDKVPLTNLINLEKDSERFTYVFDGNAQVLDHILVSPALLELLMGTDVLHFNSTTPAIPLEDDPGTPFSVSDHDPLESRFKFETPVSVNEAPTPVRFATFNASLNRFNAGDLAAELSAPGSDQPDVIAEIIQRTRPDVLLINEFDYDAGGAAADGFQTNYLSVEHNGAASIEYPYRFVAPSNTGIPSGFDFNNDGSVGGADDAFGFGFFPGQYGMVVYSMYPIDYASIRTFQNFLWKDMPGALLPDDPATPEPADWYSDDELDVFRLSSKSHWDVPIQIDGKTVHFLVSHPTPPVFDGSEDRNGTRNFDEIRFWADYVGPGKDQGSYIYDDAGNKGGLPPGAMFVIAGDQNSDPLDGDSIPGSIQQLLDHPLVNTKTTPSSPGGPEQAALQGGANDTHLSDPAFDTADFADSDPGNLRADYVLPRKNLKIEDAAVFWPLSTDPLFSLVGTFPFPSSDHRLVWVDVRVPSE